MNVKTKFIAIFLSCATVTLLSHAEVNRKGQRAIGLSSWEDVTTPLTAGLNHENHRGSAWCDYDNDGLQDLYVTHFGAFDPNGIYLGSPNQLLRNLGSGVFEDATTVELEANSGLSHHPAWADLDNDGLPDIYISQSSNSGSELSTLLHQDSVGVFSDITNGDPIGMSGILPRGVGWQDVNNDGLVDLLVANSNGDLKKNRMLINAGGTNFTLAATLFSEEMRESRSIGWCDYNNDGLPDVYITNGAEDHSDELQRTNQLYKNMGDGTWTDVAVEAGVGDIGHGRGQVWGDVNNDGFLDLFVGNQKGSDTGGGHNRLFRNNGDGTFNDITAWAGLFESYRTRGVSMADFDNDGYLDIYVVNFGNALPPNHLYRNNGNNTFTEVAGGTLASGGPGNGASASWADFDNDGWVDLYLVGGSTIAPGSGMNLLLRNANQNG
ncbi:MAG TPA: VCBS repeat-containing protein, partial [Phycisphaerales bacterium]|nr:VCBS repeat-containing protein [Phycisphaerales bacterium]